MNRRSEDHVGGIECFHVCITFTINFQYLFLEASLIPNYLQLDIFHGVLEERNLRSLFLSSVIYLAIVERLCTVYVLNVNVLPEFSKISEKN